MRHGLRVALLYVGFAHLSLLIACLLLARHAGDWPTFYRPEVIGALHLVTLGWISGSILGMCYLVAPLALRTPLPGTARDYVFCAAFMAGVTGMSASVWRGNYVGLAAAAPLVLAAITGLGWRIVRGLRLSGIPAGVRLHVELAFANMLLAGALGIAMGLDRRWGFLPASPLAQTWAHAHLAVIGWAVLMVIGLSYRLLPMLVVSRPVEGPRLARTAWLIEAGLAAIVTGHLAAWPRLLPLGGLLVTAGIVLFFTEVRGIVSRRERRGVKPMRPDRTVSLSHAATLWLIASMLLGLWLAAAPRTLQSSGLIWVYGVAAIVGYLSQIVIGMGGRLFPMLAWYVHMAEHGRAPECVPQDLVVDRLVNMTCWTWLPGVPALAIGLGFTLPALTAAASVSLAIGVVANGAHLVAMLRRCEKIRGV